MPDDLLRVARAHDVRWLTLHDPATRNALSPALVARLEQAVDDAARDADLRALVLRGHGGFFCAGGHVGNFQQRAQTEGGAQDDPAASRNRAFGALLQHLAALPVPVVVAVEGAAMGGGLGLACCADLVLATEGARFALTETGLGLIPAQIAPFVQARLGRRITLRLGLSGERVQGAQAQALGLADALAPDGAALDALQAQWLTRLLACGPQANRTLKGLLSAHDDGPLPAGETLGAWLDAAAQSFAQCLRGEGVEGVAALRARRAPAWAVTVTAQDVRRLHGLDAAPGVAASPGVRP